MTNRENRLSYFDNLKVLLSVLVIAFHVALFFFPASGWPITVKNPSDEIPYMWTFVFFFLVFVMSLFFFVSGYFLPLSYSHTPSGFLKKKFVRLGIPMLVVTAIHYVLFGFFGVGHMWFAQYLLVFYGLYFVLKMTKKNRMPIVVRPSFMGYVLVICMLAVISFYSRKCLGYGIGRVLGGLLVYDSSHLPFHVVLFMMGVFCYRNNWIALISEFSAWLMFCSSMIVFVLFCFYIQDGCLKYWAAKSTCCVEAFVCVSLCLSLVVLFKKYGAWNNKFWRWCATHIYGVYVVHLYVVLLLQYCFKDIHMNGYGKFILLFAGSTVLSYVIAWIIGCCVDRIIHEFCLK